MFAESEIVKLLEQKQRLIQESELFRLELAAETVAILQTRYWAGRLKTILLTAAPVAGFFLARSWRGERGRWSRTWMVWKNFRRAYSLWTLYKKFFQRESQEPRGPNPNPMR
jgi:hypothetical protein